MALTVNTNIASLTAQRNLTGSQDALSTSLQRLSSGLRINSAKDDAAGLAISERFTAQIRGLNQGVRNANDGISLAQTAEGALKEVTSNLQRIRELAVQSANATNSDSDRQALQSEVAQLVAEIDRVAQKTTFNGIALLDGTFTSKTFQVGADVGSTVSISSIDSVRTSALGGSSYATVTGNANVDANAIASGTFINGIQVGATSTDGLSVDEQTASALAKANAINAVSSSTGVTATASTSITGAAAESTAGGSEGSFSFSLNDVTITYTNSTTAALTATEAVNAINAKTASTGVTATADVAGKITLAAADGRNITVAEIVGDTGAAEAGLTADTYRGALTLTSGSSSGIKLSATADGVAASSALLGFTDAAYTPDAGTADASTSENYNVVALGTGVAVSSLSVTTASNASAAITSADNALSTINSIRATLGSIQSRFESVVANLQTTAENLSASRSRIMDADFASETANLTKAQILQQSGIAMLAQANAIPQNVLALLQ